MLRFWLAWPVAFRTGFLSEHHLLQRNMNGSTSIGQCNRNVLFHCARHDSADRIHKLPFDPALAKLEQNLPNHDASELLTSTRSTQKYSFAHSKCALKVHSVEILQRQTLFISLLLRCLAKKMFNCILEKRRKHFLVA